MLRRRHSGYPTTPGMFLFAGLVALVIATVIFLPATEGKAEHRPLGTIYGVSTPTSSPTTAVGATPVPTGTQTPTAMPTAQCQAEWKVVPAPSLGTFRDVAAISSDDVWVVGDDGAIHWDGASWSHVPTAGVTNLDSISALGHGDMWAINGSSVIHWDGTAWSLMYDPPFKPQGGSGYSDLEAISSDDVWVVGSHWPSTSYREATYAVHWNGEEWTVAPSPGSGTQGNRMISVSGIAGGYAWATGFWIGPMLLQWTGTDWVPSGLESEDAWAWYMADIEVIAANDVWSVGGDIRTNPPSTVILHYDGAQWTKISTPDVGELQAVSAAAPDDVWAVGQFGTLHWDGSAWSQVPAPAGELIAVDAVGPEDAWAVGGAVVMHYSNDPFWDVPQSSPFYSYVRCLACLGIVSGYSDASFRTNERVTRGQAAKIIANAAGYNDDIPAGHQTFADVAPDSPFWVYIERVYAHGAIGGYPCGAEAEGEPCPGIYYRPSAYLTRGQLAKIATNVAGYDDTPVGQTFNDVPPGSPFYTFIERSAIHNVISGYPCGGTNPDTGEAEPCPGAYFRPASNVTRGQTAKIVANSLLPGCEVPTRP